MAGFTCLAISVAALSGMMWMKSFLQTPASPFQKQVLFTVFPGQNLTIIAANLEKKGLITNALGFNLYARYKKAATRIKAGEYQLSMNATPEGVLALLISGKIKLYRFTVPEGLNMQEIADLAQAGGFCTRSRFLSLCKEIDFINELKIPAITLEGYLFPDTYYFSKEADCKTLIKKMTATFNQVFTPQWRERAKELGFTPHEIVILASIIEKETGNAAERSLISSVFHNRLKRHMRLESDPTVIYGASDYHGKIRYKHLRQVTPYNTYKISGLPAGPIANPGAKALEAALYPEKSNYLFFVSKNDTTHQFSTNLKDHNKAVKKYQLLKR